MKPELRLEPMQKWFKSKKAPFLISGPCSVETEEQLLKTAAELAATGKVDVLRAGIWKPRTRPGDFEGVGSVGLEWLQTAKEETGLPVAVEVANADHVEEALKAGVDILWIGARSTVNPFTVQEIADSLKGVDVPVLVKNPATPDLQLWIGALERINRTGITKLGVIHRGFTSFGERTFRNNPMWELPIQLKTFCPELPIFNDPSHICGNRELIPYISQKALNLDMQGLMIESHIHPDQAWTDSKQQLNPKQVSDLIGELVIREPSSVNKDFTDQLKVLRSRIDELDELILQKIGERMEVVEQIGKYKNENQVTVLQVKRWEQLFKDRKSLAKALKLNEEFTENLLGLLHNESIRKQNDIMKS